MDNLEEILKTEKLVEIIENNNKIIDYELFRKNKKVYFNNIDDFLKIAKNLDQEPLFYGNHPMHPCPNHISTHFRYKGWNFNSNTKRRY